MYDTAVKNARSIALARQTPRANVAGRGRRWLRRLYHRLFWIKYFDAVIGRYPTAYIMGGCPHFIGRKPLMDQS